MFSFLLILFIAVNTSHSLQCITNCSLSGFRFGEMFRIPDGQCQQRAAASECYANVEFNYYLRKYEVVFSLRGTSRDFIYINSHFRLTYDISYLCSKETSCVISYINNRISEMVARDYNAGRIYEEIAPYIENPLQNGSVQCYDMRNNIITCPSGAICSLDYDPKGRRTRSRGCETNHGGLVSVFDGITYTSLHIYCVRNLCNTDATLDKIKTILINNGLTDSDGRRIAGTTKGLASRLVVIFTLVFIALSPFRN